MIIATHEVPVPFNKLLEFYLYDSGQVASLLSHLIVQSIVAYVQYYNAASTLVLAWAVTFQSKNVAISPPTSIQLHSPPLYRTTPWSNIDCSLNA